MARVFKAQKTKVSQKKQRLRIDSIDQHGAGICLSTKPLTIVPGVLADELVDVQVTNKSKQVQKAKLLSVIESSSNRTEPFCPHYAQCGGCSLQHVSHDNGFALKQQALQKRFANVHGINDDAWQNPVTSEKAYRRKVRLAVDARNPNKVCIGYRMSASNKIVDIQACPILTPPLQTLVQELLPVLKTSKSIRHIGHIVLLDAADTCLVSFHCTKTPDDKLRAKIIELSHELQFSFDFTSSEKQGEETETLLSVKGHHQQTIMLSAQDFIQVNEGVNGKMLKLALDYLAPKNTQVLHDFFAGAGNFSLTFADQVKQVKAYEVSEKMTQRARLNAKNNGLGNITCTTANLDDEKVLASLDLSADDIVILDPARSGAFALCQQLKRTPVNKILYVSCNPNTFLRDFTELNALYSLNTISALDMFPYTEHMEVMALLTRR